MNKTYLEFLSKRKVQKLWQNMIEHEIQLRHVISFEDWFGDDSVLVQLTPYVWLIPFLVTVIILTIFKRAKLFGYTQRYLLVIMVMDLLFSLLTGIRDITLHLLEMDYGYIEYKMCRILLSSFYLQNCFHGTSLWIKCMMSFTQCIFVAFPLKCRIWKLKKFVIAFAMLHLTFLSVFFVLPVMTPMKGVWTFKVSEETHELKLIEACTMDFDTGFYESLLFGLLQTFGVYFLSCYCLAIPTVIDIILIIFLIFLMQKHLKLLSGMAPQTGKRSRIKYLILMKMNIILGVSFILQEAPLFTYLIVILTTSDVPKLLEAAGIYNAILTISFVIGKPLDLIIYASLSDTFRSEFSKLFLNGKKGKIFSILRYDTNTGASRNTKQPTI